VLLGLNAADAATLEFGSGSATRNAAFVYEGTGIIALRKTTTAQVLRGYRTWSDASNYERWALQSGSSYFEWAAETAGTGGDDLSLRLTPAGTGNVQVSSGGLNFGGSTSSEAGFKRSSTQLQARLGDDSDYAPFRAATITANGNDVEKPLEPYHVPVSDETTPLTAGTGKITWRMPYAFTVAAIRASLSTAQTSGSIFTVDINEGGSSILSTKLTIDNTEKTSVTAQTPAVISDASIADDAEMSIDIDQVGDGTAKGLKVVLIGRRS
jgi:hypothetical protein